MYEAARVAQRADHIAAWEDGFRALSAYVAAHRRLPGAKDGKVTRWLNTQRANGRAGTLSRDRLARLERLGVVVYARDARWPKRYAQLQAFQRQHGHFSVPQGDLAGLAGWLARCRQQWSRGTLSPERVRMLERLGVERDPRGEGWDGFFERLEEHKRHHRGRLPQPLWSWLGRQRMLFRQGKLSKERQRRLEPLVVLRPEPVWQRRCAEIAAFRRRHGRLPRNRPGSEQSLAHWIVSQRMRWRRGELSGAKRAELSRFGVSPDEVLERWEERFQELATYRRRNGRFPRAGEQTVLSRWVNQQRLLEVGGKLDPKRRQRLMSLGLELQPMEATWRRRYLELGTFQRSHGHVRIKTGGSEDGLFRWLWAQRRRWTRGELAPERRRALEHLGVEPDARGALWQAQFRRLAAHRARYGRRSVKELPPPLKKWLLEQHRRSRKGSIRPEEERALRSLGALELVPSPLEVRELRFRQLADFKRRTGHTLVPRDWKAHPGLAVWVLNQRGRLGIGLLPERTRQRLRAMGFVESPQQAAWEQRFSELAAFAKEHRHCRVMPPTHRRLWEWCMRQRRKHRQRKLPAEAHQRLVQIGFAFDRTFDEFRGRSWEAWFEELGRYLETSGRRVPPMGHRLRPFVEWLRSRHRYGPALPGALVRGMERIGFELRPLDAHWERQFAAVSTFVQERGYFPSHNTPGLGPWLYGQRKAREAGELPVERERRLRGLGFTFEASPLPSEDPMLEQARQFQRRHGHLAVPQASHAHLAGWLELQRRLRSRGTLRLKTFQNLERIGMPWSASELAWERGYAQLMDFRRRHGTSPIPAGTALSRWVTAQQRKYRAEQLSLDEEQRLNAAEALRP